MNFLDIIIGTPYWIWILFVYLFIVGLKATKPNVLQLWRTGVIPLIFMTWSFYSVYNKNTPYSPFVGLWFVALIMGALIGYQILRRLKISIDSAKLIHFPGSFVPLLLSITFFILKYILGVTYALYPTMKENVMLINSDLVISGFISGIFLGRFIGVLSQYIKAMNK